LLAQSRTSSVATIGFSTKSYFGHEQLKAWISEVGRGQELADIQQFVVPSFPSLPLALALAPEWLLVGAQDCSAFPAGAHTGEVSAKLLAELGVDFVELGHAELRAGSDDNLVIAQKVKQATENGLDVLLCIGETKSSDPKSAAKECILQIESSGITAHNSVLAYEPVWAIGAAEPASAKHITATVELIREHFGAECPRIIYGGAAGSGLFLQVFPKVEGLFLGRMAHQPKEFLKIVSEASGVIAKSD
jgi:triosephosphate isomerase